MTNHTTPTPSRKRGRPTVADSERSDYRSVQFCMTIPREVAEALSAQELRRLSLEARHVFNNFINKAAQAILERRENK